MTSPSSIQLTELSQLNTSSGFLQKPKFLKRQGTKVLSRDVHVTFSVHAEHLSLINLMVLLVLGWPFYTSLDAKEVTEQ